MQDKQLPPSSALAALYRFAATASPLEVESASEQVLPWPKNDFLDASFTSHVPFERSSFQRMYRLKECIGSGSQGTVYLAINTALGTEAAIKITTSNLYSSCMEAKMLQACQCEFVTKLLNVFASPCLIALSMEYVPVTMYQYLTRQHDSLVSRVCS